MVLVNPCSKVRIKIPKPLRTNVSANDMPHLIQVCGPVRDKLIVALLADTGLRLSEVAMVRLSDIDLDRSTITVWGNGAKQRVVRFGPSTNELMLEWLSVRPNTDALLELTPRGIAAMLTRLQMQTGIKCNAKPRTA